MTEITNAMRERANAEVAKQQKIVDRLEEKYNKIRLQMRALEIELNAERHFLAHYKANAAATAHAEEMPQEIDDEVIPEDYEEPVSPEEEEQVDEDELSTVTAIRGLHPARVDDDLASPQVVEDTSWVEAAKERDKKIKKRFEPRPEARFSISRET